MPMPNTFSYVTLSLDGGGEVVGLTQFSELDIPWTAVLMSPII